MKRISTAKAGDWSAFDAYLREVTALPVLSDEEVTALCIQACAGDAPAQERLVKGHLRLVVRLAHHYAGFGLPLADLISEGNIGLIRAAELYDPKFGTKFSTYASVWIKQRMHRAITSQARAVRIPVWRSQRLRKVSRLNDELSAQLGRTATEDDLADRLGLSPEQLAELRGDRFEVVSLDAPAEPDGDSATALHHALPDEHAVDPSLHLGRQELLDEMIACLHDLDDRELEILSFKYGLRPQGEVSFRQLAKRFGVSHEWVRRIAELAVVKMRRALDQGRGWPTGERQRRKKSVLQRIRALNAAATA